MMSATEANIQTTKNKNAKIEREKELLLAFAEKRIKEAVVSGHYSCRIDYRDFESSAVEYCKEFLINHGYNITSLGSTRFCIDWLGD